MSDPTNLCSVRVRPYMAYIHSARSEYGGGEWKNEALPARWFMKRRGTRAKGVGKIIYRLCPRIIFQAKTAGTFFSSSCPLTRVLVLTAKSQDLTGEPPLINPRLFFLRKAMCSTFNCRLLQTMSRLLQSPMRNLAITRWSYCEHLLSAVLAPIARIRVHGLVCTRVHSTYSYIM